MFAKQQHYFTFPSAICEGSKFSTLFPKLVIVHLTGSYHPSCEVIPYRGFGLHFSSNDGDDHVTNGYLYAFCREIYVQILCSVLKISFISFLSLNFNGNLIYRFLCFFTVFPESFASKYYLSYGVLKPTWSFINLAGMQQG